MQENMLQQRLLRRHLTTARIATGQTPHNGLNHVIAIVLQFLQVILQHRILPHARIHCRREEHRRLRRHDGRREHVVADAISHLANHVGCTRSHQEEVSPLGQRHVLHVEVEVTVKGIHDALVVRQRLKRHRRDEVRCILRHDHMHVSIQLHQHRCQIGNLIGGDTARHTQNDGLSCQHNSLFP